MRIGPDIVNSIDTNRVNISGCWLWSTEDVFPPNYSVVLNKQYIEASGTWVELPISVEAVTLDFLRWKVPYAEIVIRVSADPMSTVVWAGAVYTVPDDVIESTTPGGGTGSVTSVGLQMPSPLFSVANSPVTAAGNLAVTMTGDGSGIVLDNGSTTPISTFAPRKAFYYSKFPVPVTNTTALTTLVPGILPCLSADQIPSVPLSVRGNGVIQWSTLTDFVTWNFKLGTAVLSTFTAAGSDLKVANTATEYMWELELQINFTAAPSAATDVQLIGTLTIYDGYVVLPFAINSTVSVDTLVSNTFGCTVQWNAAAAGNGLRCDWFNVCGINVSETIVPISALTVQSLSVNTAITAVLSNGNNVVIGASGVPGALTADTTITFSGQTTGATTYVRFKQFTTAVNVTFTIAGFTFYQDGKTAGMASGSPVLLAADMVASCYYTAAITWLSSTSASVSLSKN